MLFQRKRGHLSPSSRRSPVFSLMIFILPVWFSEPWKQELFKAHTDKWIHRALFCFSFCFFKKNFHPVIHYSINLSGAAHGSSDECCSCEMSFRTWFHWNLVLNTCYFDLKANYEGAEPKPEMNKKKSHWFYRDGCQKQLTNHEPMQRWEVGSKLLFGWVLKSMESRKWLR